MWDRLTSAPAFAPLTRSAQSLLGLRGQSRWPIESVNLLAPEAENIDSSLGTQVGKGSRMSAAADRIDVLDEAGRSIGWVDPRSGARNLLDPAQAKEFGEMVDFWMTTAGVDGPDEDGRRPHRPDVGL